MYDYGTTPEQVAMVKVIHSEHASNNPKALYKKRYSVDDVLGSRIICKPLHLLDCCVETDNATAIIVTRADRAPTCGTHRADPRHRRRCSKPRMDMHYQAGPIDRVAGIMPRHPLANAGVGPEDWTPLARTTRSPSPRCCNWRITGSARRARAARMSRTGRCGWAESGEQHLGRASVRGYTHGMNMVIENVRQLRHDVDDSCPIGPDGKRQHTYDYREGGCAGARHRGDGESGLGQSGTGRPWSCGAASVLPLRSLRLQRTQGMSRPLNTETGTAHGDPR